MTLELSADEVLSTTRSVRLRLDLQREVGEEILRQCLEIALQAPTGSLRQDWHFVISNDRNQCREVGLIYKEVWTSMITDNYLDSSSNNKAQKATKQLG